MQKFLEKFFLSQKLVSSTNRLHLITILIDIKTKFNPTFLTICIKLLYSQIHFETNCIFMTNYMTLSFFFSQKWQNLGTKKKYIQCMVHQTILCLEHVDKNMPWVKTHNFLNDEQGSYIFLISVRPKYNNINVWQ